MISDPIGDFLIRIKNGYLAQRKRVSAPYSKIKEELAKILVEEGYLKSSRFEVRPFDRARGRGSRKEMIVTLKYKDGEAALTEVKRVSKPGRRIYVKKDKIPRVLSGLGRVIISTPQGLMTGKKAKKKGIGGEVICKIW